LRALVVEDDEVVADDLAQTLGQIGYVVDIAGDGEAAWFKGASEDYDIAIVDLGLPRIDGLSVLKRWRSANRTFPILILSARGDWMDKVTGIDAGADDYLAKPFQMAELISRVRSLVRRAAGRVSPTISVGSLVVDTTRMAITFRGSPVPLSQLEFRLIQYLAHHVDRPVSAGELAEHLYGDPEEVDANTIEALVLRLRKKLSPATIRTRRGFGYQLDQALP
jgi:two-component system OmpR family response regulator